MTSDFVLEIVSRDDIVTTHVLTLPFDVTRAKIINPPTLLTFEFEPGIFVSHLLLTWSKGELEIDGHDLTTLSLPKLLKIPFCYNILAHPNHVRLLYGVHGIYTPFPWYDNAPEAVNEQPELTLE